ncbi:hypothetical protein NL676_039028 [Syzygium grande]|nr:hypothetical protein NL676_039028 [Syzygium grande]
MQSYTKAVVESSCEQAYADVNWDELGFNLIPADYMYIMKCTDGENFSQGALTRYTKLQLDPSAAILNYGQGLLEGLKAQRTKDGRILLFRPEENGLRMKMGAERLCMPSPSLEQFVDSVKQTVLANQHWVPPPGKGSLYVRPLLIGSGPVLRMGPAPEFTFVVYASPVGNLHKGQMSMKLVIQDKSHRATPGGTGGIKSITNYSPVFKPISEAKSSGFSDILFLDAATGKFIEEASSCNVFTVKGNVISTPALQDTILPGITRKSIIDIALSFKYQVEECLLMVEDVMDADEVFCTGTAVGVTPVGSVTYQGKRCEYKTGEDTVTERLRARLEAIQIGTAEDDFGWTSTLNQA